MNYNGTVIHERDEMVSLTDMWRASGSPSKKKPSDWLSQLATKEFITHVQATFDAGQTGIDGQKGGRGGSGNTFAHWQIAMAYAKRRPPNLRGVMFGRGPVTLNLTRVKFGNRGEDGAPAGHAGGANLKVGAICAA